MYSEGQVKIRQEEAKWRGIELGEHEEKMWDMATSCS